MGRRRLKFDGVETTFETTHQRYVLVRQSPDRAEFDQHDERKPRQPRVRVMQWRFIPTRGKIRYVRSAGIFRDDVYLIGGPTNAIY